MTNREAHPDYASYPVGMRVAFRGNRDEHVRVKTGDNTWECGCKLIESDADIFVANGGYEHSGSCGIIILHDPRTAGKPPAFKPGGDGTSKKPDQKKLDCLREAAAAIQRAIELETKGGK